MLLVHAEFAARDRAAFELETQPVGERPIDPPSEPEIAVAKREIAEPIAVPQPISIARAEPGEVDAQHGSERELGLQTELARSHRDAIGRPPAQVEERVQLRARVLDRSS